MTDTRAHAREIVLAASPDRVFQLLITPSDIRNWWGASRVIVQPQLGGTWIAAWGENENDPDYTSAATIHDFNPPHRLFLTDICYTSKTGVLPFVANFTIEFIVAAHPDGALLRVMQGGFPIDSSADEFYEACDVGWNDTLKSMQQYINESM